MAVFGSVLEMIFVSGMNFKIVVGCIFRTIGLGIRKRWDGAWICFWKNLC